ncbi:MAG TPA: hypothetical protein PKN75_03230 [Bacteroidia bacterium]|nr:hypothetical protein [Bacteroidia bacterium]HNU32581.1 hypothetical protein [Bacteroidia bacterium]
MIRCTPAKRINESNYYLLQKPYWGVKIGDNLYCDKAEVSNIEWLEYMYWTARVFGMNSNEYIATLPDTLVWMPYPCLKENVELYLRHPKNQMLPIVGITQLQAVDFSQWRSDRVFEQLLVKLNKIEFDTAPNRNTYFTSSKYFEGIYYKIKPGEKVKYYPDYGLPNLTERRKILLFNDSVNEAYFKNDRVLLSKLDSNDIPFVVCNILPCNNFVLQKEPISYPSFPTHQKRNELDHIRGNVGEWTNEINISAGGGWLDKGKAIMQQDTFYVEGANAWTGFRNVMVWEQWFP